jgi:hypothetical protein
MKCKNSPEFCSGTATESNGYCFMCAEETACLLFEAALEFGATKESAAALAQKAWK